MTIKRKLENRRVDRFGNVVYEGDFLYENIYKGRDITDLVDVSSDIDLYNQMMDKLGLKYLKIGEYTEPREDFDAFHEKRMYEWNMPIGYLELDIYEFFSERVETPEEIERISQELELFEKYNCFNVLRFLIYLVDTFKENGIVWGVGRGSSVASYCLYIIGIHKVNSIKYGLDMEEFFKEVKNR